MTALALVVVAVDVAGAGWMTASSSSPCPWSGSPCSRCAARSRPMSRDWRWPSQAPSLRSVERLRRRRPPRSRSARWRASWSFGDSVGRPSSRGAFRDEGSAPWRASRVFAALLLGLPALLDSSDDRTVALVDAMFRSGALVFGGGHVVLPLLHDAVVAPGWVGEQEFLAGYGLVQAMPGPLFTFSAYLGAVRRAVADRDRRRGDRARSPSSCRRSCCSAACCRSGRSIRRHAAVQAALAGVGAAVVGVLAAAFWDPVLTTSIDGIGDVAFAAGLLVLLRVLPVWAVVPLAAAVRRAGLLAARSPRTAATSP